MLIIRKKQMQAMQAGVVDAYAVAAVQRIEKKFPAPFNRLGRTEVEKMVRDGVAAAARYGVEDDPQVDRFVDLLFRIAPDFEKHPDGEWILDILEDQAVDEKARMDLIYEALAEDPAFLKDPA